MNLLQQILDHLLFVRARRRIDPLVALLHLHALVDQQRHVAAVVDHQLRPQQSTLAVREAQRLVRAPPVLLQRLALPRKHRHARRRNRRRRMVLRREDIAARPAHLRAQRHHRLDQHRRLDRHVQRTGHANASQRLARGILVADRHQPRHLLLGDVDLLAAKLRQRNIRYLIVAPSLGPQSYPLSLSPLLHLISNSEFVTIPSRITV